MISFQRLLGREEEFWELLEASAREGVNSVAALKRTLANRDTACVLDEFAVARRKDKKITEEISEKLLTTFVTPMEREDLESLAQCLYKIPKTVEKFAERYLIVADRMRDVDFGRQVALMEQAVALVFQMTQTLRAGTHLAGIKPLQTRLQHIEVEADNELLHLLQPCFAPGFPALKGVILKDLFDLNEKVVDRCRDAGSVISHVILKNS